MVLGAVFYKGTETGSSFGIIVLGFVRSDENLKINMSQKWALRIPKYAARLGDLGKRVFGPKFTNNSRSNLHFRVLGFSDVVRHEL